MEYSFAPVFAHWNQTFWFQFPRTIFARTARALQRYFPEHAEEMRGIAEELQENGIDASYEYLSAWAYRHELQHARVDGVTGMPACTGIVAQAHDGTITHGRNEDLEPRFARNLTLSLRFAQPGAKPLLYGTDWYWFTTGLRTAMRPGVASVSGNFRFAPPRPLDGVLAEIERGVMPDMLVFRQVLLGAAGPPAGRRAADSFEAVLEQLASVEVATPSYYVVAGTVSGEGAVVSRSPGNSSAIVRLGSEGVVGDVSWTEQRAPKRASLVGLGADELRPVGARSEGRPPADRRDQRAPFVRAEPGRLRSGPLRSAVDVSRPQ